MDAAIFAGHGAVEEIARIELDAGLVGQEFEDAAGQRIFDPRRQPRFADGAAAQAKIVIVALADPKLFVRVADARADAMRFAEIERRCLDRAGRAQRNAGRR